MINRFINTTQAGENQFNFRSGIEKIVEDKELFDVTLVCDDGDIDAHKVLLSITSEFFLSVLKKSSHPHPLLYMKGLKKVQLRSVVDFLYYGEVNVGLSHSDLFEDLRLLDCAGGWLSIIEFIGKGYLNFSPNVHLFSFRFLWTHYYMMCVMTWAIFRFAIFT